MDNLYNLRLADCAERSQKIPEHLRQLAEDVCAPYQNALVAVIFYGACLWQKDVINGLPDFMVIVSNYRNIWGHKKWLRIAGTCLPPNVFYHTMQTQTAKFNCKYAVISVDHLKAGCKDWFHSYIFGRLAQPVALIASSDDQIKLINTALTTATERLLGEAIGLIDKPFSGLYLWRIALRYSYGAELRPEPENRVDSLVEQSQHYFKITADAWLETATQRSSDQQWCHLQPSKKTVFKRRWFYRALWGKHLSAMRLMKAYFTFSGGIDYIIYKIERHSGQTIDVPNRVYKWPLIFLWGLLFKLWRQGLFR